MRAVPLFAIAMLGLAAAGCASVDAPAPAATASAPAPVEGYDWFYDVHAGEARLSYGLEASDEMRLGLTCSAGAGKLVMTATAPSGVREIYLESGGETERFPAEGEPSQLHDGDFLTAEASADVPVFQRFRRVGWLASWHDGRRDTYAPHAGAVPDIERFFAFCA